MNNQIEKLARSYVANCGDVAVAIKETMPAMADKSDAACRSHFDKTYKDQPTFWRVVDEYRERVKEQVALTAADLMQHWAKIAGADARELVQIKTVPCSACWQGWPSDKLLPKLPNLGCRGCHGNGYQTVLITDTGKLSETGRLLYRGAEQTKNGIKVHLADQDKALDNLARALGMFTTQLQIAAQVQPVLPALPTDQNEASKVYAEWVKGV